MSAPPLVAAPRVAVVVATTGEHDLVEGCLAGLATQTRPADQIVLVGNGAPAGFLAGIRRRHPDVTVVELPRNTGFAGGYNAGIRAAAGEFVAIVNDDAIPEAGWLEELLRVVHADQAAGVVACTVVDAGDGVSVDSQGLGLALDGMSRQVRPRAGAPARPLLASGCACLFRRAALDEAGLFDERFFAYCEDADLSLRLLWAGYHTTLAPAAVVRHHGSAATGRYSLRKVFWVERNHFWVAAKGFPWPLLALVPAVTVWRYLLQIRLLRSRGTELGGFVAAAGPARAAATVVRAQLAALAGLPYVVRERRRVLRGRRASQLGMARTLVAQRLTLRDVLDLPEPALARERAAAGAWLPPWVRQQHAARYRFVAPLLAGEDVIECSCGDGSSTAAMLAGEPRSLRGFDVDEPAVAAARARVTDPRAAFAAAEARDLPCETGGAGVYVCLETIEHVSDAAALLAEARRVLRPGGLFVCSTPNRAVTCPGAGPDERPLNPFHVREFERGELEDLLAPHFEGLEWYGQTPLWLAHARLLTWVGRRWTPRAAARLAQAFKLPLLLRSPAAPHEVRPLAAGDSCEYLLVVGRARPKA
jgi:GT2 family glycosyltransferase/SAM-dependent methyltransferase